ncbi:type II toxin-antitoxin system YafO family toxin [Enterobacter quasiroggenkampii]|uniref:type II toxin-antitoxin system YafO family toxin n=1 Tax=Enterobacter quasiroggenkampii TaxID=2497436 RepID=UPI0021D230AD|nr:type II toxin-antitoxin system YafO family toxin [Enterobacter quasiroggenkampii]MCU6348213.1 type II toxin-antitoxin system YafO family toxin [Enterobacter quasiroggenkampii]
MSKVYVSDLFKTIQNWQSYYLDFYDYKINHKKIDRFGRDINLKASYLFHIHLATNDQIKAKWKSRSSYNRTTALKDPNSDYWLIYAYDKVNNDYLLLFVAGPNAHDENTWNSFFNTLSTNIAAPWIDGKVTYTEENF